jgi:hypothetical protein
MKTRFWMTALVVVIIALSNTSCIRGRLPTVTKDEVLKMPPFTATLEKIDVWYPDMFGTEVDLWFKKDDGNQMCLPISPASKTIVNFARTLHEGQNYTFPQALADYLILADSINKQGTNTFKQ